MWTSWCSMRQITRLWPHLCPRVDSFVSVVYMIELKFSRQDLIFGYALKRHTVHATSKGAHQNENHNSSQFSFLLRAPNV